MAMMITAIAKAVEQMFKTMLGIANTEAQTTAAINENILAGRILNFKENDKQKLAVILMTILFVIVMAVMIIKSIRKK